MRIETSSLEEHGRRLFLHSPRVAGQSQATCGYQKTPPWVNVVWIHDTAPLRLCSANHENHRQLGGFSEASGAVAAVYDRRDVRSPKIVPCLSTPGTEPTASPRRSQRMDRRQNPTLWIEVTGHALPCDAADFHPARIAQCRRPCSRGPNALTGQKVPAAAGTRARHSFSSSPANAVSIEVCGPS